jgi:GDSL-like lipase/acylhydrolase family protein
VNASSQAPQSEQREVAWLGIASVAVAVVAWFALVLHYEYGVAWLGNYVGSEDVLFVAGVAGIVLMRSVQRWGLARVRSAAGRFAFSLAVLIVALFAAEFTVRHTMRGVIPDARPTFVLNSLGFREREIGPKDPHRYRIVMMGDSFTYGNGVELQDRFSNLIEASLGPQYEVLNFGHPGDNLPDHLALLKLVLSINPDFVLLQLYENDFETPGMMPRRPRSYPLLPAGLDNQLMKSSVLYRLLDDHWVQFQEAVGLSERYTHYMAQHLQDPNAPDAVQTSGMLLQFIDRARAAGVSNGAVLFPALYALGQKGANYPFGFLNDRVSNIYTLEQAPYLDLLPAFLTVHDPPSLLVSRFDPHPNAKANHLAAIAILNRFESLWHH